MKLAIIGSRNVNISRDRFASLTDDLMPKEMGETEVIISGGAEGVDRLAAWYAHYKHYKLTEYRPNYPIFGRRAPLIRNDSIVAEADFVIAFWDGVSCGTLNAINTAIRMSKPLLVYYIKSDTVRLFAPDSQTEQELDI